MVKAERTTLTRKRKKAKVYKSIEEEQTNADETSDEAKVVRQKRHVNRKKRKEDKNQLRLLWKQVRLTKWPPNHWGLVWSKVKKRLLACGHCRKENAGCFFIVFTVKKAKLPEITA